MSEEAAFVQLTYDQLAQLGQSDLCCSPAQLYREDELAALPQDVLSLSSGCGHPVDSAGITEGETVVDVGAGAGADCFLAARLTGPAGRVIGVDPAPSMRALAEHHRDRMDLPWVGFMAGNAAELPLPGAIADVVISNCVLSLATDATAAWQEITRVLKPGGRFVVSDIIGGDPEAGLRARARCETGLSWDDYRGVLRDCGLHTLRILRVGPATFRDGFRAQSVTIAGRRSAGEVDAIVLYEPGHAEAAAELAERVDRTARELGLRCSGYTRASDTIWGKQLRQLFGGGPTAGLLLIVDAGTVLTARPADLPDLGPAIEKYLREEAEQ